MSKTNDPALEAFIAATTEIDEVLERQAANRADNNFG